MKVNVYLPEYSRKLSGILQAFADGIELVDPGVVDVRPLGEPARCDVAVIFGLVKRAYRPTWGKQAILDRHAGRSLLVIESAFVRRGIYWTVGFGGINGAADFRAAGVPLDRWRRLGIKVKPWSQRKDGPVVVAGQLPRDTNVQDTDHLAWVRNAVESCQGGGRRVVFRPHPRIENPEIYGIPPELYDPNRKIATTLKGARCLVTWNSNSATDAAIAGVPVVTCDPQSFAWPVASHDFRGVKDPWRPDRNDWLAGLGYAQWSLVEMRNGDPWRHLTGAA